VSLNRQPGKSEIPQRPDWPGRPVSATLAVRGRRPPYKNLRHPGEVYLLALRVEGLAQGLYHYDGLHHRLKKIRRVDASKKAVEYSAQVMNSWIRPPRSSS
jgi:hypothetical protein